MKEEKERKKPSELSFLQKLGQKPSFAERKTLPLKRHFRFSALCNEVCYVNSVKVKVSNIWNTFFKLTMIFWYKLSLLYSFNVTIAIGHMLKLKLSKCAKDQFLINKFKWTRNLGWIVKSVLHLTFYNLHQFALCTVYMACTLWIWSYFANGNSLHKATLYVFGNTAFGYA